MKSEKRIEQEITLECSQVGSTVFKNQVGTAYRGRMIVKNGVRMILDPVLVRYGLDKGSSDLIGIRPMVITQDMVGKTFGQFLSIEVKKDKTKGYKATKEQKDWIAFINGNGGLGFVCDDPDEIKEKLNGR